MSDTKNGLEDKVEEINPHQDFVEEDETREMPKEGLIYPIQRLCKKKKHTKDYYLCKEPVSKAYRCALALKMNEVYYCPRPEKK